MQGKHSKKSCKPSSCGVEYTSGISFLMSRFWTPCRMSFAKMSMALILLDFTTFLMKFDWENNFLVLECGGLMAKGITGTGQGFDLPGRCLGGSPINSRCHHCAHLLWLPQRTGNDAILSCHQILNVQVVTAITRPRIAQYKLLPWLLKGDYTMTCGASPSPQIVSRLLKELLDILKAQVFP